MSGAQKDETNITAGHTPPETLFPQTCPKPSIRVPEGLAQKPREKDLFTSVCSSVKPSSVLEIGSWLGASALGWHKAATKLGQTSKIYCIDTWLGSPEHFLETHGKEWGKDKLLISERGPQFFEGFLSNIHRWGCGDSIVPMRADSQSALKYLSANKALFDVIYVDGAHDEISVYMDITLSFQVLQKGGIICGDDFGWPSVRTGLFLAISDNSVPNLKVMFNGPDFVIISPENNHYNEFFRNRGFKQWKPLREQLSTIVRFCIKKTGFAIRKKAGFYKPKNNRPLNKN